MAKSEQELSTFVEKAFTVYFNVDELPADWTAYKRDALPSWAKSAAGYLYLNVGAPEVPALIHMLRDAGENQDSSLVEAMSEGSNMSWDHNSETWSVLQEILRNIILNLEDRLNSKE